MYNYTKSSFDNLEYFYENLIFVNKGAVFCTLRILYDKENISITVENNENTMSWEDTCHNHEKWIVNKDMYKYINDFKTFIPNVSCDQYESYVLSKQFLILLLQENIKRLPLICFNFTNLEVFLKSIDILYKQKFNINTIKILFYKIFYDYIDKDIMCNDTKYDIVNVLSNKTSKTKIKLKRLQPYMKYINCFKEENEQNMMINIIKQHFQSKDIITVHEFYEQCSILRNNSLEYKKHSTLLKHFFKNNTERYSFCNRLNKLYGNIVLLVVFKKKEENTPYHDSLYTDLNYILKCF